MPFPFNIGDGTAGIPCNPTSPADTDIFRALQGQTSAEEQFVSGIYDARQVVRIWNRANSNQRRALRRLIQMMTVKAVSAGVYLTASSEPPGWKKVPLDRQRLKESVRRVLRYPAPPPVTSPASGKPHISVVEADCLDAALALQSVGYNPAVLVLASASHPGGGYLKGAGAQEENLCRRTTLWLSLSDPYNWNHSRRQLYPLPTFGGIYSPDVAVFRKSEDNGYEYFEKPEHLAFINVAAYPHPPLETVNGQLSLTHRIEQDYLHKITAILAIACTQGHDSVILGAFGCGAFANPPAHVARIFRQAINQFPAAGQLRRIVFAILDDHNAWRAHNPEGNIIPFARTFGCHPAPSFGEWQQQLSSERNPAQASSSH